MSQTCQNCYQDFRICKCVHWSKTPHCVDCASAFADISLKLEAVEKERNHAVSQFERAGVAYVERVGQLEAENAALREENDGIRATNLSLGIQNQALREEVATLTDMLMAVNKHVVPGVADSIDGLKKIFADLAASQKEVEMLKFNSIDNYEFWTGLKWVPLSEHSITMRPRTCR
jgi:hypothetical protein